MVNRLVAAVYLVASTPSCPVVSQPSCAPRIDRLKFQSTQYGPVEPTGARTSSALLMQFGMSIGAVYGTIFTGQSTWPQDYMLLREHRAATDSELQYTGAANDSIFLQHGMILRRR